MSEYVVLALMVLGVAFVRTKISKITIFEYEKGLKYQNGKFKEVLEPGRHWIYDPSTSVETVDIRQRSITIPGQEVLSSDGVTLKVSLAARYEVIRPETAVNQSEDFVGALYQSLQIGLREIIGQAKIEQILESRADFGARLMELGKEPANELGLNLLHVSIKDIMFPGELKKIFSQVAQAKQEGLAALERARGETAALRNLANAAKLASANPALLQLRLIQQLGASQGNSVVLGFPPSSAPLPLKTPGRTPREI